MKTRLLVTAVIFVVAGAVFWTAGCWMNPAAQRIPKGPPASAIQVGGEDASDDTSSADAGTAASEESTARTSEDTGASEPSEPAAESDERESDSEYDQSPPPTHEKPEEIEP